MQIKKFLAPSILPIALCAMFGLTACDSKSDTPSNPAGTEVLPPNPDVGGDVGGGNVGGGDVGGGNVGGTPTVTTYPALAPTASPLYAKATYDSWKPFHYVNMEDEMVYYPDFAADFSSVFEPAYLPAGRVIWSVQSTGMYRVQCQNEGTAKSAMKYRACTVSEGIGYGMLLTLVNEDYDAFNRLWNYSRAYRAYHGVNLTPWITKSFMYDKIDISSATDADLDIATSLILQYFKNLAVAPDIANLYLADALVIVKDIWDWEVEPNLLLLMSGDTDMWHDSDPTYNLSYFSPVALRLFAMVDPTHNWAGVLDAMYAYMAKVQSLGTGVFPDWSNGAGIAVNPPNGAAGKTEATYTWHTFNKESVRIPWRIAWDYYWFQDPRALAILTGLNNFIVAKSGGDPSSVALATQYSWDPAKSDYDKNTSVPAQWLAAWCATGLGTNQTWLNACTQLVNATTLGNNGTSYFTDILQALYSSLLNGKFVRPF